jgi:hypothetical protein
LSAIIHEIACQASLGAVKAHADEADSAPAAEECVVLDVQGTASSAATAAERPSGVLTPGVLPMPMGQERRFPE